MPGFLKNLQTALQPNLAQLDGSPVKFSHAWSVLMLNLASTDPSFAQPTTRCAPPCHQLHLRSPVFAVTGILHAAAAYDKD